MSEENDYNLTVIQLPVSDEERAIVEKWLIPNIFPNNGAGFDLNTPQCNFFQALSPKLPPPIYSRAAISFSYEDTDPERFRPAFVSDKKYFEFLETLKMGEGQIDLVDIHPPTHEIVKDLLIGRVKIFHHGVEVKHPSIKEKLENTLKNYPESSLFTGCQTDRVKSPPFRKRVLFKTFTQRGKDEP